MSKFKLVEVTEVPEARACQSQLYRSIIDSFLEQGMKIARVEYEGNRATYVSGLRNVAKGYEETIQVIQRKDDIYLWRLD